MSSSDPGRVELATHDGVATLTLDRSGRHNSLVPAFLDQIEAAIAELSDADVGAVVLRAEGPSFSTGGDVASFAAHRDDLAGYADRVVGALNRVILGMIRLHAPIVAAVHAQVTGGSIGLVLASDVVAVSERATFTPWYREVGFAPDGGWTAMLPKVIGRTRAADVLMTNRSITARESVDWGMATRLVSGDAASEAEMVARSISTGVRGSVSHTKRGLWDDIDALAAALDDERRRFVEQVVSAEASEGMARFLRRGQDGSRSAT